MRRTIFSIAGAFGLNRLFAFINRNRPSVLAFHGVTASEPGVFCNHHGKHLYLPVFTRLMEHIVARYNAVPLARIVDWLEDGEPLPERAIVVTFDDGYRNVLKNAAPVLDRLGIPATLFVVTDFVFHGQMLWPDRLVSALSLTTERELTVEYGDRSWTVPLRNSNEKITADNWLRSICKSLPDVERVALIDRAMEHLGVDEGRAAAAWSDHDPIGQDELKELSALGIELGSHTCSHGIATRYTAEQWQRELAESKRLVESASGRACNEFSYPNGARGDYDETTRHHVMDAGFRCAVTTIKNRVSPRADRFEIPRFILTHNETTLAEFAAEVSGYPDFLRTVKNKVASGSTTARTGGGQT